METNTSRIEKLEQAVTLLIQQQKIEEKNREDLKQLNRNMLTLQDRLESEISRRQELELEIVDLKEKLNNVNKSTTIDNHNSTIEEYLNYYSPNQDNSKHRHTSVRSTYQTLNRTDIRAKSDNVETEEPSKRISPHQYESSPKSPPLSQLIPSKSGIRSSPAVQVGIAEQKQTVPSLKSPTQVPHTPHIQRNHNNKNMNDRMINISDSTSISQHRRGDNQIAMKLKPEVPQQSPTYTPGPSNSDKPMRHCRSNGSKNGNISTEHKEMISLSPVPTPRQNISAASGIKTITKTTGTPSPTFNSSIDMSSASPRTISVSMIYTPQSDPKQTTMRRTT